MNRSAVLLFAAMLQTALAVPARSAELRVVIEGIQKPEGHVLLSVSGSADAWNGKEDAVKQASLAVTDTRVDTVIANLQPGRYAVQVAHDANDNGKLDINLVGMPIEGYGFSNNPPVMRRATFDEAAIELSTAGATVTIHLN